MDQSNHHTHPPSADGNGPAEKAKGVHYSKAGSCCCNWKDNAELSRRLASSPLEKDHVWKRNGGFFKLKLDDSGIGAIMVETLRHHIGAEIQERDKQVYFARHHCTDHIRASFADV